jgi:hypothetical protein
MKKVITLVSAFMMWISASLAGDYTLIAAGSDWKYLDDGTDQGTAWIAPGFNDASWQTGLAELGYGDGDEATVLSFGPDASNKYITYYFRKNFNVLNPNQFKNLYVAMVVDDGAVVYVNGVEAIRYNLPVGSDYLTLAPNNIEAHFERTYFYFAIDPSLLVAGNNVIAVEVHQNRPESSDLSFNLQMIASTETKIIPRGSDWKYFDQGVDLGTSWHSVGYNDASWATGKAILGYNTTANSRLENTTISYGPSTSSKYRTTYFRKTIHIADTSAFGKIGLNLLLDDGAVIYINGVEAVRQNMPGGTITYNTFANVTVGTATWYFLPIDKTLLQNGINEFSAEVHQVTAGSSDKYFEFELTELPPPPIPGGGCAIQTIGCFTSVDGGCGQTAGFIIPSTHTFQYIMAQNDPYSIGGGNMAGLHDFTGFLPVDGLGGSSTEGYLMINHENTTGSVSQLGLHFDVYTGLWVVDSSKAIDFSQVAGTSRNCSGGITYWKTTVTSEETMTTGDSNGDGYIDRGWHVELDPQTGKPVDYDNDGIPDKMWALGRSNKENIVFKNDSLTAYFGLDDTNNGFLFKFVANQKADFSSGTLYVLTSPSLLAPSGTWVQVPNTTQADRNNSQSLANGLGARNYTRIEDVEIGPDGMIYFAATTSGRIYRLQDNGATISDFEIYIQGNQGYTYATDNGIQTTTFASADNLAFDNDGNLWINCDGGCSPIWVAQAGHSMGDPKMELFARTPSGSESTGATFSPDGKFMFLSIQHPNTGNSTQVTDAAGNNVVFNRSTTIVIARKEDLGADAAIPFVDLGADIEVCADVPVTLDPGSGYTAYLWNTGETTQTITAISPGTYTVEVTGANGRTNTASVNVTHLTLPIVSINATSLVVCDGNSVVLNAFGADSYVWDNGVVDGVAFIPAQTATYSVVGIAINGCSASANVVVEVNSNPVVVASANSTVVCEGDAIVLTGSGALTYTWNNGASDGVSFTAAITETYTVTGVDVNGCEGQDQITVVVNELPQVIASASQNQICEGEQVTISSTGNAVSYSWDNGITEGVAFTPVSTQTYTVTALSTDGCENTASVQVVVNNLPVVSINGLNSTYLHTDANITMIGTPAGGTFSGIGVSGNVFSPSAAGIGGPYVITYTYIDPATGCENSESFSVSVEANTTGVFELGENGSFKVYPNPFADVINLQINANVSDKMIIEVTNLQGKQVFNRELIIYIGESRVELFELNQLSSGVYNLTVTLGNTSSTQKIVKK